MTRNSKPQFRPSPTSDCCYPIWDLEFEIWDFGIEVFHGATMAMVGVASALVGRLHAWPGSDVGAASAGGRARGVHWLQLVGGQRRCFHRGAERGGRSGRS